MYICIYKIVLQVLQIQLYFLIIILNLIFLHKTYRFVVEGY